MSVGQPSQTRQRSIVAAALDVPFSTVLAGSLLAVVVACALFPSLGPHDPGAIDATKSLRLPGDGHLLGTDQLGRDILSRVVAGARTSLVGPLILAGGVTFISASVALLAGWFGGLLDAVVTRLVDLVYSIPSLLIAIIVVGVTGGGFYVTVFVLILFNLPLSIRGLRAAVLERVSLPYMEAAETLGLPRWRILLTQLLPAIAPFILVSFILRFTFSIVELSSLSFLGIGVPPGAPDWGRMVADNRATMYANVWATAAPAIAIVILAVSANLMGEWLYRRYDESGRSR